MIQLLLSFLPNIFWFSCVIRRQCWSGSLSGCRITLGPIRRLLAGADGREKNPNITNAQTCCTLLKRNTGSYQVYKHTNTHQWTWSLEKQNSSSWRRHSDKKWFSGLWESFWLKSPRIPGPVTEVYAETLPGCRFVHWGTWCSHLCTSIEQWIRDTRASLFVLHVALMVSVVLHKRLVFPLLRVLSCWIFAESLLNLCSSFQLLQRFSRPPLLLPTSTCWAHTAIYSEATSLCTLEKIDDELHNKTREQSGFICAADFKCVSTLIQGFI